LINLPNTTNEFRC